MRAVPTLVHFWGVTCGPCKVELPLLGQFAKKHPEIDVVTISADLVPNLPAATQSMLDKAGLSVDREFPLQRRLCRTPAI